VGPRIHYEMRVQISQRKGAFMRRGDGPVKVQGHSTVNSAKTAEQIEMPFGRKTRV